MSQETLTWLNENTLVGFTEKRGDAWHYKASEQGEEPNHYLGAIPVEDVRRRLFNWRHVEAQVTATYTDSVGEQQVVTDPSRKAIVRPDTGAILGLFKDGYQGHHYDEWLLDQVASILDDDLQVGSAGLLSGGGKAWVSVEAPENLTTPEGVEFRPHLLATTSLDGTIATTYKRVVTRVVCDNTAEAALREDGQQVKIRHSRYSTVRLAEARDALNVVYSIADDFAAEVKALCELPVSNGQWMKFLDLSFPIEGKTGRGLTVATRARDTYNRLYRLDERCAPWQNTAFGVLQTANTALLHESRVHGGNRVERNQRLLLTGGVQEADKQAQTLLARALA